MEIEESRIVIARGITFVHVKSESSDNYYVTLFGLPTDEEAEGRAKAQLDFEEPESLWVEHIERVPEATVIYER